MASDEDKKKERLLVEQAESLLSSFPKEPQIEDRLTLEALRYLNKAITLDPENDDAWNNRGSAKNNIGDHHSAMADYDKAIIWGGGIGVLAVVFIIWRSLFAVTVSYEIATAEGTSRDHANFIFMIMMAGVIAISMKIVGVLLITALLIIPAATARRFSTSPEQMALLSSLIGLVSVWVGLMGSLEWDIPAGPSIVVAALVCFVLSVISLPKRKITLK